MHSPPSGCRPVISHISYIKKEDVKWAQKWTVWKMSNWGPFVARGKKVRLKVWGEALWSTGVEKSHSAVSSTCECGEAAEAAAELGEDSCRKDLRWVSFFFFFFYGCYSVKTTGVYMSTAAMPGCMCRGKRREMRDVWIVREVKKKGGMVFDRETVGSLEQVCVYEKRINLLSFLLPLLHLFYSQRCIASVTLLCRNFPHSTFACKWSLSEYLQWWEK